MLHMSVNPLPHFRLYWRKDNRFNRSMTNSPRIYTGSSLFMYELMRRYITAEEPINTENAPKRGHDMHDPLQRFRRIHVKLNEIFVRYIVPGETFSLDEAMVGCKLRCFLIVTVKNKLPRPESASGCWPTQTRGTLYFSVSTLDFSQSNDRGAIAWKRSFMLCWMYSSHTLVLTWIDCLCTFQ
jgi:hypothetical protein